MSIYTFSIQSAMGLVALNIFNIYKTPNTLPFSFTGTNQEQPLSSWYNVVTPRMEYERDFAPHLRLTTGRGICLCFSTGPTEAYLGPSQKCLTSPL